jgi:hypothetical protein
VDCVGLTVGRRAQRGDHRVGVPVDIANECDWLPRIVCISHTIERSARASSVFDDVARDWAMMSIGDAFVQPLFEVLCSPIAGSIAWRANGDSD